MQLQETMDFHASDASHWYPVHGSFEVVG